MVKSYQEIVRTSSKRVPNSSNPPHPSGRGSTPLHHPSAGPLSPLPSNTNHDGRTPDANSYNGTNESGTVGTGSVKEKKTRGTRQRRNAGGRRTRQHEVGRAAHWQRLAGAHLLHLLDVSMRREEEHIPTINPTLTRRTPTVLLYIRSMLPTLFLRRQITTRATLPPLPPLLLPFSPLPLAVSPPPPPPPTLPPLHRHQRRPE
jgi:hypothetical protein